MVLHHHFYFFICLLACIISTIIIWGWKPTTLWTQLTPPPLVPLLWAPRLFSIVGHQIRGERGREPWQNKSISQRSSSSSNRSIRATPTPNRTIIIICVPHASPSPQPYPLTTKKKERGRGRRNWVQVDTHLPTQLVGPMCPLLPWVQVANIN